MPELNLEAIDAFKMGNDPYKDLADAFQQKAIQNVMTENKEAIQASLLDVRSSRSISKTTLAHRREQRIATLQERIAADDGKTYVQQVLEERREKL